MDIDEEAQAGVSGDRAGKKRFEVKKVNNCFVLYTYPFFSLYDLKETLVNV